MPWPWFKITLIHSGFLILHAADLYTTSMISPAQEANPIMRTLWIQGGFDMMIIAKILGWGFMLIYNIALLKWLPPMYSKAVWVSQFIGLFAMILLVIWNVYIVF